ncbi:MAG: phage terminase large subunit [Alphaproteobacteria bacterium]
MANKVSKSDFKKTLSDYALNFRKQIENANSGFDDSKQAANKRIAEAFVDFEFFSRTYFPHYIRDKKNPLTQMLERVKPSLLHKWLYLTFPKIFKSPFGVSQALAAPRGEAKTTYVMIAIMYCIVYDLKHYILFIQDVFDNAAVLIEAIKAELEYNQRLKNDFPHACGKSSIWKEGVIVTKNNIKIHARGAGQKLRGLKHGAFRPDLVILDDIENDELVVRVENRNKLNEWLNKAVENLGEAGAKLDIIYIGTILHYDSVLNRTLNNPMWQSVIFKAIVEWPHNMALWDRWEEILRNTDKATAQAAADEFYFQNKAQMDEGAVVSWPDKRDLYSLMKLRVKVGTASFEAEYQNDPLSSEDAIFTDFTYWNVLSEKLIFFGAVDPSLGKKGQNRDPSAIVIGGINRTTMKMKLFVADIKKRVPDKIISDMIYYQKKYNCVLWFVETVQFQEFLRTEIQRRAKLDNVIMPCIGINQNVDKDLRIQSLQPYVNGGDIEFDPSHSALINQMKHWPKTAHDDGVDALHILWTNAVKYANRTQTGGLKTLSSIGSSLFRRKECRVGLNAYK